MTTNELVDWLRGELTNQKLMHGEAEDAFDGNRMWYYKGSQDMIMDVLQKLTGEDASQD